MLCKKPYMLGVLPCGCGQCLPCRINRRRLWTHRMILESATHVGSCFVTLTYNDSNLPFGSSVVPKDVQDWLKRLRKAIYPSKIRFFLVGEYGDNTQRPHYHAAIFGLDQLIGGGENGQQGLVQKTWGKGHTYVGDLSPQSASYICGYVTKKMTKKDDPRLKGRHPEFARMSLRPGIGAYAMLDVASCFEMDHSVYMEKTADVPYVLSYGKRKLPLGRYLRSLLRQNLGYGRKPSDESLQIFQEKMRLLYEDERYAASKEARPINYNYELDKNKQLCLNMEARFKIRNTRGEL